MRWFKPNLRSSLHAIFAAAQPTPPPATQVQVDIDDIRAAMLDLIGNATDDRSITITRRIRYALEVEALWFLRGDLMGILARIHGETIAFEKIEAISDLFDNLLPEGLRSRPSPLSANPKD